MATTDITTTLQQLSLSQLSIDPQQSSPLFQLPAELRTLICGFALRRASGTIVVNLNDTSSQKIRSDTELPSYALLLTCKRLNDECANLQFDVNQIRIHAPIFFASDASSSRAKRDRVIIRLRKLAESPSRMNQLRGATIYLGYLPQLHELRCTDFLSAWLAFLDAISSARQLVSTWQLTFRVFLRTGRYASFTFGLESLEDVLNGMSNARLHDGSAAKLLEFEAERVGKIRAMLVKTLFPDQASIGTGKPSCLEKTSS